MVRLPAVVGRVGRAGGCSGIGTRIDCSIILSSRVPARSVSCPRSSYLESGQPLKLLITGIAE